MKSYISYKNERSLLHIKQYAYYITHYKYNWHKYIELLFVLEGEIEVNKNGISHIMSKGDVILINSNIGHATMARVPDSIAMVIHFDPIYFSTWIKDYKNVHFKCVSNETTRELPVFRNIYDTALKMASYTGKKDSMSRIIYESLFHNLIGQLFIYFSPDMLNNNDAGYMTTNENVIRIVDYLNKYFREKITLEHLAEVTSYNKSYISQIVKQNLGINYYEYLTRVRMREAVFSLTNTTEKISDIAFSNGFSDVKSFNTAFKDRFGKSPSQYRKMLIHSPKIESSNVKIFIEDTDLKEIINGIVEDHGNQFDKSRLQGAETVEKNYMEEVSAISDDLVDVIEKLNKISSKINLSKK